MRVAKAVLLTSLIFLMSCGKKASIVNTGAVTIKLASVPSPPLFPGTTAVITATVYDQTNQGVTWTITPVNFGTLSKQTSTSDSSNSQVQASVTFTTPTNFASKTTVTITATSVSNPSITASLPLQVSPVSISLQLLDQLTGIIIPASTQSINQGDQLLVFAQVSNELTGQDVTWSVSPANGAGTLAGETPVSATYVAPSQVSSLQTVTLRAASVSNPDANASMQINVFPSGAGPNVAVLDVDGGPVPGQNYRNHAFTSVTICNPSSFTCQTVNGVLVDTNSYGLRILQSQIPFLNLPTLTDGNGNTLQNCDLLPNGSYLWGPVATADLYISGEYGAATVVQVISSSNALVPNSCSNGGTTNENTPELLGANGILGVGPEPTDCTLAGVNLCDGSKQSTPPNLYYSCPSSGCAATDSPVVVAANTQVTNPVTQLANQVNDRRDGNGIVFQFPAVSGPASSIVGTMTFGIGTQTNNSLNNATVFTLDKNSHFTTDFSGQTLTDSVIDSAANALFFPDSLPVCSDNKQYFCPTSPTNLSAVIHGATQGQSTVTFSVDNADAFFSKPGDSVFGALAGPQGTYRSCSKGNSSCVFSWGLPFFYGRTLYEAIDGQLIFGAPTAPWWAF